MKKKLIYSSLAIIGGLLSMGLDCGGDKYGCNFASANRCQEWETTAPGQDVSYRQLCSASNGAFLEDGCPTENLVGSCEVSENSDAASVKDHYYAPKTLADAQEDCMEASGTFEAP